MLKYHTCGLCLLIRFALVYSQVSEMLSSAAKDFVKDQAFNVLVSYTKDQFRDATSSVVLQNYDFEIDIPNMTSIVDGWCFEISDQAHPYLTADGALQLDNIAAVIGYYSKGKSFLINMLHNAAQNTLDDGKWFGNEDGDTLLPIGPGVTTKGITGILTGHGNGDISSATGLILDCAGRNAPTTSFRDRMNGSNECPLEDNKCKADVTGKYDKNKLDKVKHDIYDMRAKERLLDDVVVDVSDLIFYVTDELLNEDQRMILYMIEENSKLRKPKKIVIVHNFKRLSCSGDGISKFIYEQIAHPFGAELVTDSDPMFKLAFIHIHSEGIWKSRWVVNDDLFVTVFHLVLFEHIDECKAVNNDMFRYIAINFLNTKNQQDSNSRRDIAFTTLLANSIGKRLGDFITFSPKPPENSTNENENISNELKTKIHYVKPTCSRYIIDGDFANQIVKLHKWELRDLPPGDYNGEFQPDSQVFYDGKDAEVLIITINLPSLNEHHEISPKNELNSKILKKNWYRIKFEKGKKDENYFIIEGYCEKMFTRLSNNLYGSFSVRFAVNSRYIFHSKLMLDGRLIIWCYVQDFEEQLGPPKPPPLLEFQGKWFGPGYKIAQEVKEEKENTKGE